MPSHVAEKPHTKTSYLNAASFSDFLRDKKFSSAAATILGHGYMGQAYVYALQELGVKDITVCSRSQKSIQLISDGDIKTLSGGFLNLKEAPKKNQIGIVATPISSLIPATKHLISLGYKKILCEKPVSLYSEEIQELSALCQKESVDVVCAFNRLAYPSFIEVMSRAESDGGFTSCRYEFTELIDRIDFGSISESVKSRWGIANSLHVLSMAHGLVGLPKTAHTERSGRLDWHLSGAVFGGIGTTESGIPFVYHADWGSRGRWLVEVQTKKASYLLCPMEKVFQKKNSLSAWEEIPVVAYSDKSKPGILEQVAALLNDDVRQRLPLFNLNQTAQLTKFAEDVFGYSKNREGTK